MASKTTEKFIEVLQEAEKTNNLDPLVAIFTEDAEITNLATPKPLRGREGARQFWQKYLSVFNNIRSRFTHVVESDGTAVLEWNSQGDLSSGEPIDYRGVTVLETNNGQVQRFRTYYDSAAFLPQGAKK